MKLKEEQGGKAERPMKVEGVEFHLKDKPPTPPNTA